MQSNTTLNVGSAYQKSADRLKAVEISKGRQAAEAAGCTARSRRMTQTGAETFFSKRECSSDHTRRTSTPNRRERSRSEAPSVGRFQSAHRDQNPAVPTPPFVQSSRAT